MAETQLLLLGTGTPNILPDRAQSALAVIVADQAYVVDCGGAVMQRIAEARHRYDLTALHPPHLTHLFLTHLHPDHTTGLPDFIIAPWVLMRSEALQIYGPPGTQNLVDYIQAGYAIGIGEHRDGLAPLNHPLTVAVHEIEAGQIFQDERVTVTAFRVQHGNLMAYGYRFQTPDKTIVISGDTCPTDTLMQAAQNCDILVHEVYSAKMLAQRPPAWQAYHRAVHTSTLELAEIANQIQPELLVLTHQLFWGTSDEELLQEITNSYAGQVVSGYDLLLVE
jgi:ribonuclease BN (tRNA processing enzyme)